MDPPCSPPTQQTSMCPFPQRRASIILPILKNGSLISIGNFCDEEHVAIFVNHHLHIVAMDEAPPNAAFQVPADLDVLRGHCNPANLLWSLQFYNDEPFNASTGMQCNSMLAPESLPNCLAFLHASLFRPTTRTLCIAINNGFLTTFPSLAYASVRKHLSKYIDTAKGHLGQKRQGIQLIQPPSLPPE